MELEGRITERIAALKKERDQFLVQVDQTIAAYNAAIGELKRVLNPSATETPGQKQEPAQATEKQEGPTIT